ncbi:MAG: putative sulfate exporter family transporter, partial [Cycloclasticus sp.]|nr:putative sulfate exporter family transporter [Cycloclasticus sp.]
FSFSLIQTFGLLNQEQVNVVSKMSHYALIVAMSGIGLKIAFDGIVKNGKKALLIASMIFGLQIIMSSGLVLVFLR